MKRILGILGILLIGILVVGIAGLLCAWIGAMLFNNIVVEDLHQVTEPITTWQLFKLELIVNCLLAVALCGIRMAQNND